MDAHRLKSWPKYYADIVAGKPFDLRLADRDYKIGDTVQFEEFRPATGERTGMCCQRRITYIAKGSDFEQWGLKPGYCVLGLAPLPGAEKYDQLAAGQATPAA